MRLADDTRHTRETGPDDSTSTPCFRGIDNKTFFDTLRARGTPFVASGFDGSVITTGLSSSVCVPELDILLDSTSCTTSDRSITVTQQPACLLTVSLVYDVLPVVTEKSTIRNIDDPPMVAANA